MKSRTSFSKLTAFKKDILRFAPIWALYLIGMMLVLFEMSDFSYSYYSYYDRFAKNTMSGLIEAFGVVNIIYAAVCAVMLFGDLYNTRMCYSLHAMPQRRESWLLSHLGAGMLFSLVPNTLAALFLMTQLQSMWYLALYWLLAVTLQFVFFFGLATVSALLTGNRFAMLAVYAGFNFVAMLIYAVLEVIYVPMLYGVVTNVSDFTPFSPAVHLFEFDFFEFESYRVASTMFPNEWETRYRFTGLGTGWGYTAIIGAVGLLAMGLAVLLYRLRHLECAGDFIAFRKLKAPSCLIITLCVALCFALVGDLMGSGYAIWMSVGVVVGFFGSLMLLERRVKVFRKKTFLGFGILVAALIISFLAVQFDWFGIEDWTPRADQVKSVTISNYRSSNYYYDNYGSRISVDITQKDEIADIIEAHADIIDRKNENADRTYYVRITYKLRSGRTVTRAYRAPASGKSYQIISGNFNDPDKVLGYKDWDSFVAGVQYMDFDCGRIPKGMYEKLLNALRSDCEKGYVTLDYPVTYAYSLFYQVLEQDRTINREVYISLGAKETIALLESPEAIMGYTDWAQYLRELNGVYVEGAPLDAQQYEGLLTAMREDCEDGTLSTEFWTEYYASIAVEDGDGFYREFWVTKECTATLTWLKENGIMDQDGNIAGK